MFLNPRKAIKEGWLKNVIEENVQPNAIDVPLTTVYDLFAHTPFFLYKKEKVHRVRKELKPTDIKGVLMWELTPGPYDFVSECYVEVPEGVCGWLITRSTLNRNGIIIHSGLYDSGYKGHLSGSIYVFRGLCYIEPGTCIAQFIMASSDSCGVYTGDYNTEQGQIPEQLKSKIIEGVRYEDRRKSRQRIENKTRKNSQRTSSVRERRI